MYLINSYSADHIFFCTLLPKKDARRNIVNINKFILKEWNCEKNTRVVDYKISYRFPHHRKQ